MFGLNVFMRTYLISQNICARISPHTPDRMQDGAYVCRGAGIALLLEKHLDCCTVSRRLDGAMLQRLIGRDGLPTGLDMQVALRERNFDIVFSKRSLDRPIIGGINRGGPLYGFVGQPDDQFKI